MAGIRENILVSTQVRDNFLQVMVALDQPNSGVVASDLANFLQANDIPLPMRGREQELSIYNILFSGTFSSCQYAFRQAMLPIADRFFLPWHRMYLIRFEEMCQQVLNDPDFRLSHWDWTADGELPVQDQWRTDLWTGD